MTVHSITASKSERADHALINCTVTVIPIVVGDGKLFLPALKAKTPDLEVIPITEFEPDNPTLKAEAP